MRKLPLQRAMRVVSLLLALISLLFPSSALRAAPRPAPSPSPSLSLPAAPVPRTSPTPSPSATPGGSTGSPMPHPSITPIRGPLTEGNCHFDPSKKWDVDAAQLGVTGAQFYGAANNRVVGSAPYQGNPRALRFQGVFGQDGSFTFGSYDEFGIFRNSAPEFLERFCDFTLSNCAAEHSYAFAIGTDGTTVGMAYNSASDTTRFLPVQWLSHDNILVPLENPRPAVWGAAVDINADGIITGIIDGKAMMWNSANDQPLDAFSARQTFVTIYSSAQVDPTGVFDAHGPHPRFPINTGAGVFPTVAATTGYATSGIPAAYAFTRQGTDNFSAPTLLPLPAGYNRSTTESYALDVTDARYEKRNGATIISGVYGQVVGYLRDRRVGAAPEYLPVVWELHRSNDTLVWRAIPLVTAQALSGSDVIAVAGNSYGEVVGQVKSGSGWRAVIYTDTLGWSDLSQAVNPARITAGQLRRGVHLTESGRVLASDGTGNAAYLLEPTYFHAVNLGATVYEELSEANGVSNYSERIVTGEEHPEVIGFGEDLTGQKTAYVWYPDPYQYEETGLFSAEPVPVTGTNVRGTAIASDGTVAGENGSQGFASTISRTSPLTSFVNVHAIGPNGITVGQLTPLLGVAQRLSGGVPQGGPTRLISSGFSKTAAWGISAFGTNDYLIVGTRENGNVKQATTWTVNGSLTSAPIASGPALPGVNNQFDQTIAYNIANNGASQAWIVGQALDTVSTSNPAFPEYSGKNVGVLWHRRDTTTEAMLLALRGIDSTGTLSVSDDTVLRSVNEEGFAVGWATRLGGLITTKRDASDPDGIQRVGVLVSAGGSCDVPGLKLYSLEQAISPSSGWLIEEARSINDNSLIAGIGRTQDNQTTALLLVPPVRDSWACEPCPTAPTLHGDYNSDGCVDMADYDLWVSQFASFGGPADGNGDGIVNIADYTVWRDNLGSGCPVAAAWADADGDADIDGTDLEVWQNNVGTTTNAGLNAGDYNQNGRVDGSDFLAWQRSAGTEAPTTATELNSLQTNFGAVTAMGRADGDLNESGNVDGTDFLIWQRTYRQPAPQPQQVQSQRQTEAMAARARRGSAFGNYLRRAAESATFAPRLRREYRSYRRRLATTH